MIKKLIQAAALLAVCSGAAQATTYDFSYTFNSANNDPAPVVTGSFAATANGNLLTNITDLSIAADGVAFNGPLSIGAWDPSVSPAGAVNFGANAAVLSIDGTQTNFVVADTNDPLLGNWTNLFYYVSGTPGTTPSGGSQEVFLGRIVGQSGFDLDAVGAWEVHPVPLPAALPLLFSGLGLLAAAKRRLCEAAAV